MPVAKAPVRFPVTPANAPLNIAILLSRVADATANALNTPGFGIAWLNCPKDIANCCPKGPACSKRTRIDSI